ncbi:MAG: translation initiation factor IF-1 [Patescibacteria group bacterium]
MSDQKQDTIKVDGEVVDTLPGAFFRVKLDNGHEILAYLSGKMKMHSIKILLGDRVTVEMTPYDLTKGRITYRMKGTGATPPPTDPTV